ncbi:unnamed protein product [Pedinophyceae sp. YPF-701]|nr:unnamed protein product [Pedinophyceae sp. YPF-701]
MADYATGLHRVFYGSVQEPEPLKELQERRWQVKHLSIAADWDSANLASARLGPNNTVVLGTLRDNHGTAQETGNRSWFYFSVEGHAAAEHVTFHITNLNKQKSLFVTHDHRPVFRLKGSTSWEHLRFRVKYRRSDTGGEMTFTHRFTSAKKHYFALCFPFSYDDNATLLRRTTALLRAHGATVTAPPAGRLAQSPAPSPARASPVPAALRNNTDPSKSVPAEALRSRMDAMSDASSCSEQEDSDNEGGGSSSGAGTQEGESRTASSSRRGSMERPATSPPLPAAGSDGGHVQGLQGVGWHGGGVAAPPRAAAARGAVSPGGRLSSEAAGVFFRREALAVTETGMRVELLTITEAGGGLTDVGPGVALHPSGPNMLPDQRPSDGHTGLGVCPEFPGRAVVVVSARVHPGETPASMMMNGVIEMLLRPHDPRAVALRRSFVFKLVPILNPEGVRAGHFRHDLHGVNLNRAYRSPDPHTQPQIHALKALLLHYARQDRLGLYLDLHAHANKRGIFAYGNSFDDVERQVEVLTFAKLCALNCPLFDVNGCNFSERNMRLTDKNGDSKEGSGRVSLFRETGLVHIYTVEANYSTTVQQNITPDAVGRPGAVSPPCRSSAPERFTAGSLMSAGRHLAVSVLDLLGENPASRLPYSEFGALSELKGWLRKCLAIAQKEKNGNMSLVLQPPLPPFPRRRTRPVQRESSRAGAPRRRPAVERGASTGSMRPHVAAADADSAAVPALPPPGGRAGAAGRHVPTRSASAVAPHTAHPPRPGRGASFQASERAAQAAHAHVRARVMRDLDSASGYANGRPHRDQPSKDPPPPAAKNAGGPARRPSGVANSERPPAQIVGLMPPSAQSARRMEVPVPADGYLPGIGGPVRSASARDGAWPPSRIPRPPLRPAPAVWATDGGPVGWGDRAPAGSWRMLEPGSAVTGLLQPGEVARMPSLRQGR